MRSARGRDANEVVGFARANKDRNPQLRDARRAVRRLIVADFQVDASAGVALFDVIENAAVDAPGAVAGREYRVDRGVHARRIQAEGGFVIVDGEAELLEVVLALRPGGGLAHLLNRREQQSNQDGDDGDDDEQFDEREPTAAHRV